jgi:hypothetical protein
MSPKAVKPLDPVRKEKSFIEDISLLTYPGSPEDFHAFESAWKAYAERTFPLVGRCFEVDAYEAPAMPNKTNHAAQLALFDASIRTENADGLDQKASEDRRRARGGETPGARSASLRHGSVLMDSCATHHIISDRRLVTNIREADRTFVITG